MEQAIATEANEKRQELAGDLMEGAEAIARELGLPRRRVFRLLELRALPAFKMAGKWYVRRSTLRAYIDRLEASGRTAGSSA